MNKSTQGIVKYLLVVAIVLPSMDSCFNLDFTPALAENRPLRPWPTFADGPRTARRWIEDFNGYFDDHFGFRRLFVRLYHRIGYRVFGVSGSRKVLIGKEGWLYYAGENAIEDYRGTTRLSEQQAARWVRHVEGRRRWLAQRGIGYLLVVVPEKSTVYPEYLPEYVTKVGTDNQRLQFLEALAAGSGVRPVDLAEVLIASKEQAALYYKYDSHWTPLGAFIGYREVMKRVAEMLPKVELQTLQDFEQRPVAIKHGDLANMISLGAVLEESAVELVPRTPYRATMTLRNDRPMDPFVRERKGTTLPRAVFFRTSYETYNEHFFSEHFSYVKYYWPRPTEGIGYDLQTVVAEDRPDVVIEVIGERAIIERTPDHETETADLAPLT